MWKLIDGQTLACRGWDDEYVVYNDLSGDTHLFGADAMQVLLQLRVAPASEETLAAALQAGPGDREALGVMLAELSALSLVERR
ncbi:HPr-rel-A system PqqD family peptide chaperone [Massilia yuzhufengensis]|uniref:PqqD family protein, HPr-rel-A system n=1 Tax=Massilia yuzhufengensis TaxID=1164594 RepID=A0A1I1DKJ6_9BURK|nr:HPr-rel-A system PqqD family peptide chaperone [Massilia yuzhufengensis]SFB75364.1 PqqD family protein, HPr-rel-A system [Massilia yuzhufengensis]